MDLAESKMRSTFMLPWQHLMLFVEFLSFLVEKNQKWQKVIFSTFSCFSGRFLQLNLVAIFGKSCLGRIKTLYKSQTYPTLIKKLPIANKWDWFENWNFLKKCFFNCGWPKMDKNRPKILQTKILVFYIKNHPGKNLLYFSSI